MPDRNREPRTRPPRPPQTPRRPAAAIRGAHLGQLPWDACVIWDLGEGLALATLSPRGVA